MKVDSTYKCIFCDKAKNNAYTYQWKSNLIIDLLNSIHPFSIRLTICPSCREKYTIQEFYDRAILKAKEHYKKTINQIHKKEAGIEE